MVSHVSVAEHARHCRLDVLPRTYRYVMGHTHVKERADAGRGAWRFQCPHLCYTNSRDVKIETERAPRFISSVRPKHSQAHSTRHRLSQDRGSRMCSGLIVINELRSAPVDGYRALLVSSAQLQPLVCML
nr:hypothetical protein CFP56_16250 [Quercus suber]